MAHADYECCAICDGKIAFAVLAAAKERICSSCVANLAMHGVIVHDVEELLDWIQSTPTLKVLATLASVGFRYCGYPNAVDEAVRGILGDALEFHWRSQQVSENGGD